MRGACRSSAHLYKLSNPSEILRPPGVQNSKSIQADKVGELGLSLGPTGEARLCSGA